MWAAWALIAGAIAVAAFLVIAAVLRFAHGDTSAALTDLAVAGVLSYLIVIAIRGERRRG